MRFDKIFVLAILINLFLINFICFAKPIPVLLKLNKQIKIKKQEIRKIEKDLKQIKKKKEILLKLYVNFLVQKELRSKNITNLADLQTYLHNLEKQELIGNIQKYLLKEIFNKEKKLKEKEKQLINELKKLEEEKKKYKRALKDAEGYFFDPITGKFISEGSYSYVIKRPAIVRAPISGKIVLIKYKPKNITIVIKNKKCEAFINNLDDIKVNLGKRIKAIQPIGIIYTNKKFFYKINCNI